MRIIYIALFCFFALTTKIMAQNSIPQEKDLGIDIQYHVALPSYDTLEKLADGADLIVFGRVLGRMPVRTLYGYDVVEDEGTKFYRNDSHPLYVRDSILNITKILKSNDEELQEGDSIIVQQPSDEINGIPVTANVSWLKKRQEVVLFLKKYITGNGKETDQYVILGLNSGRFNVLNGQVKADARAIESLKVSFPEENLESFFSKINR